MEMGIHTMSKQCSLERSEAYELYHSRGTTSTWRSWPKDSSVL